MTKFKALISDVDGTLIPSRRDGMPSLKVIEAVSKAQKLVHVGVATSRPYFMMKDIAKSLNLKGPSVVGGGAEVVNIETGEILWDKPMDPDTFEEICKILYELNLELYLKDGDQQSEILYKKGYKAKKPYNAYCPAIEPSLIDNLIEQLKNYPTITALKVPSWNIGKFDLIINHALATKQHGIFEVAKLLNIDTKEIIGIGDGHNDFPLLMACGLKIAMGNAVDDLKTIADYIAPSVDEDGLVDVIYKFVLSSN